MIIRFFNMSWLQTRFGFLLGHRFGSEVAVPVTVTEHFKTVADGAAEVNCRVASRGDRSPGVTIRLKTGNGELPVGVAKAIGIILGEQEPQHMNRAPCPVALKVAIRRFRYWFSLMFFRRCLKKVSCAAGCPARSDVRET